MMHRGGVLTARAAASVAALALIATNFVPWAWVHILGSGGGRTAVGVSWMFYAPYLSEFALLFGLVALMLLLSLAASDKRRLRLLRIALATLTIAWTGAALITLFPFLLGGSPLPRTIFVPSAGFLLGGLALALTILAYRNATRSHRRGLG
jgi:hypothetical protein